MIELFVILLVTGGTLNVTAGTLSTTVLLVSDGTLSDTVGDGNLCDTVGKYWNL